MPDLVEHIPGHRAGGRAKVMQDGGGGKFDDTGEIRVLQIVSGIKAAAGEDGVLDAGGQEVSETHPQIEVVKFLQQTVPCVIAQIFQMISIDLVYGATHLFHERPADVRFLRGAVLLFQRGQNSGVMVLSQRP